MAIQIGGTTVIDDSRNLSNIGIITATSLNISGNIGIGGSIIPDTDNIYDLGSPTKMWRDVYIGPGSLYINGQKVIEENSSNIVVTADANQNLVLQTSGSGDLELDPVGTGVIQVKGTLQIQDGTNITNSAGNNITFGNTIAVDSLTSRSANTALTLSGNGSGNVTISDTLVVNGNLDTNGTAQFDNISISGITTSNIFATGSNSNAIIISSSTITGPSTITLDPATIGDDTGTVLIKGNLQIDGTTTTINSTNLTVSDKNITIASGAANSTNADGAGIFVDGASASLTYTSTGDKWVFNKNVTATSLVKSGGTSSEFLKADGSTDSTSYTSTGKSIAMAIVFGG